MTDEATDWIQLREFAGVELEQSFALSWTVDESTLSIDVDLCLNRKHSLYEKPRPAEKACFRPAYLVFPECTRVQTNSAEGEPAHIVGAIPPGRLSTLKRGSDGRYEIGGEFGSVTVSSGRLVLRIKDLAP